MLKEYDMKRDSVEINKFLLLFQCILQVLPIDLINAQANPSQGPASNRLTVAKKYLMPRPQLAKWH